MIFLMDIDGFGYWELCTEEGLEDSTWGFIDLAKMLFIEMDENKNPTGKTWNLRFFKEWKRINPKWNKTTEENY
jgi:hypothetical protein